MSQVRVPARAWRHELAGCLHAGTATLMDSLGREPDHLLGAAWGFEYRSGDVRAEEYYWPCRAGQSLLAAVAPAAGISSHWHTPRDAADGWAEVRAELAAGHLVAVAVDNFELPFRPAYQDVHANHLVVVTGFDDEAGTVDVLDPVPPAFAGPLEQERLLAARDSGNPVRHDRDMFFTAVPIRNRWLSVSRAGEPMTWALESVRERIAANVRDWTEPAGPAAGEPDGPTWQGAAGLDTFLRDRGRALETGQDVVDELFVLAGTALAAAAVHADWLATAASAFARPDLAEAGRQVQSVAHHWSAVRILVALGRKDPTVAGRLAVRTQRLTGALDEALTTLARIPQEL